MTDVYNAAYSMIRYMSEDLTEVEHIWNSRDGVPPTHIIARDGKTMLGRVASQELKYPEHKVVPGERIIIDITEAIAHKRAAELVDVLWNDEDTPISRMFANKSVAIDHYVWDWLNDPVAPYVVTATQTEPPYYKLEDIDATGTV